MKPGEQVRHTGQPCRPVRRRRPAVYPRPVYPGTGSVPKTRTTRGTLHGTCRVSTGLRVHCYGSTGPLLRVYGGTVARWHGSMARWHGSMAGGKSHQRWDFTDFARFPDPFFGSQPNKDGFCVILVKITQNREIYRFCDFSLVYLGQAQITGRVPHVGIPAF